jgi:hypothetical protein
MILARSLIVLATLLTLSKTAHADEPIPHAQDPSLGAAAAPPRSARRAPPKPRWYGEQILAVDGLALGAMIVGVATNPGVLAAGGAAYAFGPPIVHLAHDNPYRAAGSLGIRVGAPLVGGGLGFGTGLLLTDGSWDGLFVVAGTTILGIGAGYLAAVTIDAAALAHEEDAPEPKRTTARVSSRAYRPTIAPRVDPRPDQLTLGVAGTF